MCERERETVQVVKQSIRLHTNTTVRNSNTETSIINN